MEQNQNRSSGDCYRTFSAILVIVLFISTPCLFGYDSFQRLQSLKFQNISNPGGLADNWISNIIKDSDGFIWFATENGVGRYDGTEVRGYFYDRKDTNSLYGNYVISFLIDGNDQLWIGTDLGLVAYNKACDNFNRIRTDLPYENRYFISDLELLPDNSFIALTTRRIMYYDPESGSLKQYYSLDDFPELDKSDAFSQCYFEPASGQLWIATNNKFIIAEYPSRKYRCIDHSCGTVRNLTMSEKSELWIASRQGLFSMDLNDLSVTKFLPGEKEYRSFLMKEIRDILIDNDRNFWIATDQNGIIYYERKTDRCIRYHRNIFDSQSLNSDLIRKIYIDDRGILWTGTQYEGIKYAILSNPKEFIVYTNQAGQANSISSNVITAIVKDAKNNLWLGTDGDGLNYIENASGKVTTHFYIEGRSGGISTNSILALYHDSYGNIWAGGYMGAICRYNTHTGKWKQYANRCDQPGCNGLHDVRKFLEDSKHQLWIATNGHGLFRFDYDKEEFRYYSTRNDEIIDNYVISLCEAQNGQIWVGTYNGACLLDTEKPEKHYFQYSESYPGGLSNNWIYCIHRDGKNRIWLGTANGLNRYDPEKKMFTRYYASDGLPGNVIDGILEDREGNLWISTNIGISKFNSDSTRFLNFFMEDGLPGNEFLHGSYYQSPDGEMFFGSNHGLVSFMSSNIKPDTYVSPIVIRDILVFFRSISKEKLCDMNDGGTGLKTIRLSYRQSTVTFNYTALNYVSSGNNKYSYRLDGYEQEWNHVGNRREATYINLRPGKYVFRVTGCNNDGIWDNVGDSMALVIQPPWWGTWYFRIFVGIILFLSIVGFYYWRLHEVVRQKTKLETLVNKRTFELREKNSQLDELNKMNDRIFSIISHDLRSPFNSIMGFTELLARNKDKPDEEYRNRYVGYMQVSLKKIMVLMENLLLWSSSQLKGTSICPMTYSLTEQIRNNIDLIHDAAVQKSVSIKFDSHQEFLVLADFNMIDAVIRNLLSNAVKFSNIKGEIIVSVTQEADETICSVSDKGVGVEMDDREILFSLDSRKVRSGTNGEQGSGLGLVLCRDFITRNRGRIWVESNPGNGSVFSFSIPAS